MDFAAHSVSFFTRSFTVVVGNNPEAADMDNPRGDIFGEAIAIYASNPHGDTRYLTVKMSIEAAERQVTALQARAATGRLPVAFDRWAEGRPVYGSDAYVEYGADDDIALEREEAEF